MSETIEPTTETTAPTAAEARAEASRIADHQAALTILRKLGEPLEPPDPKLVVMSRLYQLAVTFGRGWEEFEIEADRAFRGSLLALVERYAGNV